MPTSSLHLKCLAVAIVILQVTRGSESIHCFKNYSEKHSACRGHLRIRVDGTNVDECCKKGQGYVAELHKSQHGKNWLECKPCPLHHEVKEHLDNPISKRRRPTAGDRGDVSLHKTNGIVDSDSIYRKKLIDGDKFRRKSNASGRKVKKIVWSAWTDWSPCSSRCEPGIQQRTRTCLAAGCHGDDFEQRTCQPTDQCPVDGGWSLWGRWSECSTSCGHGTRRRERTCNNPLPQYSGRPCDGDDTETSACPQTVDCPVDGRWSEWSHLDACSAQPCSHEIGFRIRFRSCTSPTPLFGGLPCQGRSWKRETCYNNDFCTNPLDGVWCAWSDWTVCESGLRQRQRDCQCPPPVSGGLPCQGEAVQKVTCGELSTPKTPHINDSECDGESSGDGSSNCDDSEDGSSGSGNDDETNDSEN